jgi:nicotinamidase-related amidase
VALLVIDVQYYCAEIGGGGMHDEAHAHTHTHEGEGEKKDGTGPDTHTNTHAHTEKEDYLSHRITHTVLPNLTKIIKRARALGVEVMYTTIENLTLDGRERSLDYKLSNIDGVCVCVCV